MTQATTGKSPSSPAGVETYNLVTGPDPLPMSYERDSWEQRLLNYVHTPYAHLPYCTLCNPKILHNFWFWLPLGITAVLGQIEDNAYGKKVGGGWKRGGRDQTGCILEFVQIANQAAKLEGFVGECVREREVKRKEVLEK